MLGMSKGGRGGRGGGGKDELHICSSGNTRQMYLQKVFIIELQALHWVYFAKYFIIYYYFIFYFSVLAGLILSNCFPVPLPGNERGFLEMISQTPPPLLLPKYLLNGNMSTPNAE